MKDFTQAVQKMRDAQKAFEKSRSSNNRDVMIKYEKEVDKLLKEIVVDKVDLFTLNTIK